MITSYFIESKRTLFIDEVSNYLKGNGPRCHYAACVHYTIMPIVQRLHKSHGFTPRFPQQEGGRERGREIGREREGGREGG